MATSILIETAREYRADRRRAGETSAVKGIAPAAYFHWKRGVDLLLAILLLVPALPLMGLLVLLVRLTSRGPGIYVQVRVGKNGRTFTMYKIRSMRQDAEAGTGAVWSRTRDPRVTPLGRILRKLHLDELPQLFNILKGEMALVGPRPERPEFVPVLARRIPGYSDRHCVAPGVTGLAQVNLPPDADLDSVRRKLLLDLEYIRSAGLLMDLRLLVCTAGRLGKGFGPLLLRVFGLYREVPDLGGDCRTNASGALLQFGDTLHPSENTPPADAENAFTVDVEDYFQVSGFERHIRRDEWDRYESRVVKNTHRVLRLLDRHQVRATFFVLGWAAQRYPRLVREIYRDGHEIGSHSYWHRLVYQQTPDEFRADLRRSRDVLEDAIGAPVTAYRAPSFSITASSLWALDVLAEEGFEIDSSVFPVRHDRYGIPGAKRDLHRLAAGAGSLWEFPPSVCRLFGLNIPASGGGYFRLYPLPLTLYCIRRLRRAGKPYMFYVHPWELDPEQPRLRLGSRAVRFRHYVNIARNERKLDALLRTVRFGCVTDVIRRTVGQAASLPLGTHAAGLPLGGTGASCQLAPTTQAMLVRSP